MKKKKRSKTVDGKTKVVFVSMLVLLMGSAFLAHSRKPKGYHGRYTASQKFKFERPVGQK